MGSYLSIVNDTDDIWYCKLTYDQQTLKGGLIAFGIIAPIAAALGGFFTLGVGAPIVAVAGAGGALTFTGLTEAMVKPIVNQIMEDGKVIAPEKQPSTFTATVVSTLVKRLNEKHFHKISSHKHHRYGKMTLSLWQQATCINIVQHGGDHVAVRTLYMRPIFSGATVGSTKKHSIKHWIKKKGAENIPINGIVGQRDEGEEKEKKKSGEAKVEKSSERKLEEISTDFDMEENEDRKETPPVESKGEESVEKDEPNMASSKKITSVEVVTPAKVHGKKENEEEVPMNKHSIGKSTSEASPDDVPTRKSVEGEKAEEESVAINKEERKTKTLREEEKEDDATKEVIEDANEEERTTKKLAEIEDDATIEVIEDGAPGTPIDEKNVAKVPVEKENLKESSAKRVIQPVGNEKVEGVRVKHTVTMDVPKESPSEKLYAPAPEEEEVEEDPRKNAVENNAVKERFGKNSVVGSVEDNKVEDPPIKKPMEVNAEARVKKTVDDLNGGGMSPTVHVVEDKIGEALNKSINVVSGEEEIPAKESEVRTRPQKALVEKKEIAASPLLPVEDTPSDEDAEELKEVLTKPVVEGEEGVSTKAVETVNETETFAKHPIVKDEFKEPRTVDADVPPLKELNERESPAKQPKQPAVKDEFKNAGTRDHSVSKTPEVKVELKEAPSVAESNEKETPSKQPVLKVVLNEHAVPSVSEMIKTEVPDTNNKLKDGWGDNVGVPQVAELNEKEAHAMQPVVKDEPKNPATIDHAVPPVADEIKKDVPPKTPDVKAERNEAPTENDRIKPFADLTEKEAPAKQPVGKNEPKTNAKNVAVQPGEREKEANVLPKNYMSTEERKETGAKSDNEDEKTLKELLKKELVKEE